MQTQLGAKHVEGQKWNAENRAEPKASAHRIVFVVSRFLCGDVHRLQRHSALWTNTGTELNNFGMHRAGVTNLLLLWHWFARRGGLHRIGLRAHSDGRGGRLAKIGLRISREFLRAAFRTEKICFAPMLEMSCSFRRINGHSTNRITCHSFLTNLWSAKKLAQARISVGAYRSNRAVRRTWRWLLLFWRNAELLRRNDEGGSS